MDGPRLDAFLRGLTINEEQGLGIDPARIAQLVDSRLSPNRPREKAGTTYSDPTGDEAVGLADRRRRR